MSNPRKSPSRIRKAYRLPHGMLAALEAESRKTGLTQTKIVEFALMERLGMRKK